MYSKYFFRFIFLLLNIGFVNAQTADSTSTVVDTANNKPAVAKPPKQKEIKKLDDPLLALSSELMYRLKKMTPNQLLVIDERSVRNEKRVDDAGQEYEVTITVRLGFSQDMITGIVREVPLYQSNDREPYLLYVKIPVKFCCTTPIDTLHTKKHCGKMSELNDLEDNQHCKDWAQQDEAAEAAANTAGFGKLGGSRTTKKKGGDVTGKTTAADEEGEGFGKPIPKGKKPTKKEKNAKGQVAEDEEATTADSTKAASIADSSNTKSKKEKTDKVEKKKDTDEEGFGKPQPKSKSKKKGKSEVVKEEADASEASADSSNTKENSKPIDKKEKKEKADKVEKKKDTDEEGFGKPQPKSKSKKKGKSEVVKEEADASEASADSSNTKENSKPIDKKEKKEKADKVEQKKDTDEEGFGKPQPKTKDKKKGTSTSKDEVSKPSTDSTSLPNKEPIKPNSKNEKKKKG
jgi:hypothetical protein